MHNPPHSLLFEGNAGEAQRVLSRQIFGRKINQRADEFSLTSTSLGAAGDSDQTLLPVRAFGPRLVSTSPPPNDAMEMIAKAIFMPRSAWMRRFISTLNVVPVGDGMCGFKDSVNGDVQIGSGASVVAIIPQADGMLDLGSSTKQIQDGWFKRLIKSYNNIVTGGLGVPAIYKEAILSTQTANATILTYTPPATAGRYRVSAVITTTSATNTGTVQITLDYKDSQGTTHSTDIMALMDAAGVIATTKSGASKEYHALPWEITINNAATAIVVSVAITGTVSYTAAATIEQLA